MNGPAGYRSSPGGIADVNVPQSRTSVSSSGSSSSTSKYRHAGGGGGGGGGGSSSVGSARSGSPVSSSSSRYRATTTSRFGGSGGVPPANTTGVSGGASGSNTLHQMAQLHRFVKLNDRFDTQVFTFILPATLTKEFSPDIFSREFIYGHQKWSVSFVKSDKHLSSFLTLKHIPTGMRCAVDYTFTMHNREHFTKNESFMQKNCEFSNEQNMHGRKTFIGISDLCTRGFAHEKGVFLVELELRNMRTSFEEILQLPREFKEYFTGSRRYEKFETNYFTFGNFDWNLSIYPNGECMEVEGRPAIYLTRQTSFDHLCRVRYRITLGHGEKILESSIIEQLLDTSGSGDPYDVGCHLYNLVSSKARLKIRVDLYSVNAVSMVKIQALNRSKNSTRLYDRDKQEWTLESDIDDEYLKLRLYYSDVHNVPRKFCRYVCWSASIMPSHGRSRPIKTQGTPYSNYYSQNETEDGYEMLTDIPTNEVRFISIYVNFLN